MESSSHHRNNTNTNNNIYKKNSKGRCKPTRIPALYLFLCLVLVFLFMTFTQTYFALMTNFHQSLTTDDNNGNGNGNENMVSCLNGPPPPAIKSSKSLLYDNHHEEEKKNSPLRYPPGRQYLTPRVTPALGSHRPNVDAIFAMAFGYDIDDHLITIGSLLDTNYTGDIVLGTQAWNECSPSLQAFLKYHTTHSNLVIYEIPPCTSINPWTGSTQCSTLYAYQNPYYDNNPASKVMNRLTGKDLGARFQSPRKFRYEHYWIWSRNYHSTSRIFLVDFRDLVFQSNPLDHWTFKDPKTITKPTTLHLFEESNLRRITEVDRFTGKMIRDFFGPGMVDTIGNQTVICSGVTMGGKVAMEQYLLLMIWHMDNVMGNKVGKGDQAHHNVLYYMGEMARQEGIDDIHRWENFHGAVATTGYTYRAEGIEAGIIRDTEGQIIPIIHQFDRSRSLNKFIQKKRETEWLPEAEAATQTKMVFEKGKKKPS